MNIPKSTFKFIFFFVRLQWTYFISIIAVSVIWAANDSFFPYFLKRIVNGAANYHGTPAGIYKALGPILVVLVLFWLVTEIFLRIQGVLQLCAFPRFRANIRESVFNYVKSHSHDYFSNHLAGTLAKKLADLPTSCQTIMEIMSFNFVTALTGALIVLVMMWTAKPLFAVVLFIWLCLHLGLTALFMRYGNYLWEVHSDAVSVLSGKIGDVFSNMASVRLFARGRYEADNLKFYQKERLL